MKAFILVLLLVSLTLACANETASPDSNTKPTVELSDLQEDVRELQESAKKLEQELAKLGPTLTPSTSDKQPEPTLAADICGRFPAIQMEILRALEQGECRKATNAELFRIVALGFEGFPVATSLKPEDFAGLVNLMELRIEYHDSCGHWDDLAFTDAILAELPSLRNFELTLYRPESEPKARQKASTASDIAEAVYYAIYNGQDVEPENSVSQSDNDSMHTQIAGPAGNVRVDIQQTENLHLCRSDVSP